MAKNTVNKSIDMLGMGIMAVIGFVFGLVLFGVLWAWYLAGFTDSTTVLLTSILLIVIIYVIFILGTTIAKKYGMVYQKGVWLGIGFTIAFLIAGVILSYLGLTASVSVTASVINTSAIISLVDRIKAL